MRAVIRTNAEWARAQDYDFKVLGGLPFVVSLDDTDETHSHDEVGHAFPATREQLEALRRQIDEALSA